MTDTSGVQFGVGLRHAVIFARDAAGLPLATDTDPYEGIEIVGAKAFALTVPEPRRISHAGNDRLLALDFLPPIEGMTATLESARESLDLDAVLANVKKFQIGESQALVHASDQQGYEPQVAALLFQQSLDAVTKVRNWRFWMIPATKALPVPYGADDNPAVTRYNLSPSPVSKHIWGAALASGTEGALEAAMIRGQAEGKPKIVAWKADGTEVDFLFPATMLPIASGKVAVWDAGESVTPTVAGDLTKITFADPPTANHIIVAFYEY